MTAPYADLIERLLGIATTDHERLCQGREYSCSCGWDEENMEIGNQAAKAIEALQEDNDRLQAEVTRLLTAFDGLDPTTKGGADLIEKLSAARATPPEGEG